MFQLRPVTVDDLKSIRIINEDAIPAVNTISADKFLWFLEKSLYFKASVDNEDQVCGFLLVLPTGLNYDSLNYKWFSKNFLDFAYIDRIAINKEFRSKGIGKSLYLDLESCISKNIKIIACEFNTNPENTISKNFHESLNYCKVGTQFTENGSKQVSLMIKKINE